jgi:hypothetical protein
MKNICVYTCITGDYDDLNEIKNPEKNIDYFCFTNNKKLTSKTWQIIYISDKSLDNVRLARKIKILGHDKIKNYKIAVWTDANIVWQKSISEFISTYLKTAPFAIFKHHARNNIHDEAATCLKMNKAPKEAVIKTLDFYRSENFPDNNGLCESTVSIKEQTDPKVTKTMKLWFEMVKNFSHRDQLSFNYAVWKTGLAVNYISLNVWDNSWFYATKHATLNKIEYCSVYFGNPDIDADFELNKYFTYPYQKNNNLYQISFSVPCDTNVINLLPTNNIGVSIQNVYFNTEIKKIQFLNTVPYENKMITYSGYSPFYIYGNFRKNQKIFLSLDMTILSQPELLKLLETQCFKNAELENSISILTSKNNNLINSENELQKILNSSSWKVIQKIQKIKSSLLRH